MEEARPNILTQGLMALLKISMFILPLCLFCSVKPYKECVHEDRLDTTAAS